MSQKFSAETFLIQNTKLKFLVPLSIFTFSYQPFQCLDRDTFTSAITRCGKDTLTVGKTCDGRKEPALFHVDGLICHPYYHALVICNHGTQPQRGGGGRKDFVFIYIVSSIPRKYQGFSHIGYT